MTKPSLQSLLSKKELLELAGDKVYARGANYYHLDHVNLVFYSAHKVIAEVRGSHVYRVDFTVSEDNDFEAGCTCPAMNGWGFCKHAVATGLFLMNTPIQEIEITQKNIKLPPSSEEDSFADRYPNLACWIGDGHIEIGRDGYSSSMIRVIDQGGLVWEGGTRHISIDKMLEEAEQEIEKMDLF